MCLLRRIIFPAGSAARKFRLTRFPAQDSAVPQTNSPEAARIVDIVRGKMTELDLSAAVFGVWRGDKQIASGALGGSPLGVPATPDMQVRVGQPMEPMLSTVLLIVLYCTLGPRADANVDNAIPIGIELGKLLVPDRPPRI